MAEQPFVDKYGRVHLCDEKTASARENSFVVIQKNNELLCVYDEKLAVYAFPNTNEVTINAKPTTEFTIISYISENCKLWKELQNYRVFMVDDVDLQEIPLIWCSIEDILLNNITFDATQKIGFKNLLVRVKNEKNL